MAVASWFAASPPVRADLIVRELETGAVRIMFTPGFVSRGHRELRGPEAVERMEPVAVGDFDGDGEGDLLWRAPTTGGLAVSYLSGDRLARFQELAPEPNRESDSPPSVGDFDGDHRDDLLFGADTASERIWSPWLGRLVTPASGLGFELQQSGGDRTLLAVLRDQGRETRLLWRAAGGLVEMTTTGGKGAPPRTLGRVTAGVRFVGVTDLDADGEPDLLWQDEGEGDAVAWALSSDGALRGERRLALEPGRYRVVGAGRFRPSLSWTRNLEEAAELFGAGEIRMKEAVGGGGASTLASRLSLLKQGDRSVRIRDAGHDAIALTGSGKVLRLGEGIAVPEEIAGLREVEDIDCGNNHCLARDRHGRVWSWGGNGFGQLGRDTTVDEASPELVPSIDEILEIRAGPQHSIALDRDGNVFGWGGGFFPQLGARAGVAQWRPVRIRGFERVRHIAVGAEHVLALRSDGTVWALGSNDQGQLGTSGGQGRVLQPVRVELPGLAVGVSAFGFLSLATLEDGTVYTWGSSGEGPSATSDFNARPRLVTGIGTALESLAGHSGGMALDTNRVLWLFGDSTETNANGGPVNLPPDLELKGDTICHPPCTLDFTAAAVDPEGGPLTVTWGHCATGQTGAAASCAFPALTSAGEVAPHEVLTWFEVELAELTEHDPECMPGGLESLACRSAANRYCHASSFAGALGPLDRDLTDQEVEIACLGAGLATTVEVPFDLLGQHEPDCDRPEVAGSLACAVASHRVCSAVAAGQGGGFGPVDLGRDTALILCLGIETAREAPTDVATLTSLASSCVAGQLGSVACRTAADRYCGALGYAGGFGPVDAEGTNLTVLCSPEVTWLASSKVSVTADDGIGGVAVRTADVRVYNGEPGVALVPQPPACHPPCSSTFLARAADLDSDPLTLTWNGCAAGQNGTSVTCPITALGPVEASVIVADPAVAGASASASASGVNSPPVVEIQVGGTCHPPCTVPLSAHGVDPENDPLSFAWRGCASGAVGSSASCSYGTVEEAGAAGFQQVAVGVPAAWSTLTQLHPGCTPAAPGSAACRSATNRHCANLGYAGGYGPVEYSSSGAFLICLGASFGELRYSSFAELAGHDAGCSSSAQASTSACNTASHRYCVARSFASGFGPVEFTATAAAPYCVAASAARVISVPLVELQQQDSSCSTSQGASFGCRRAANASCWARGYGGGFGLTETPTPGSPDVKVSCLAAKRWSAVGEVSVDALDPWGGIGSDAAGIDVGNTPPGVSLLATPPSCHAPCTVTFRARAGDADDASLSYAWAGWPEVTGPEAVRQLAVAGTLSATVLVTDPLGLSASASAQATGTNLNPSVSLSGGGASCHPPCSLSLSATASDPDGDPLALDWGGCASGASGGAATCTFPTIGVFGGLTTAAPGSQLKVASWSQLSALDSACGGPSSVSSMACRNAAQRFCAASPGFVGGWGPVEYTTTQAFLSCVGPQAASLRAVSFGELGQEQSGCTSATAAGPQCLKAAYRYCVNRVAGSLSGVGPVLAQGSGASVLCLESSMSGLLWAPFSSLPRCTPSDPGSVGCRSDVRGYCEQRGYAAGFGPNEFGGLSQPVLVTCAPATIDVTTAPVNVTAADPGGGSARAEASVSVENAPPVGLIVSATPASCAAPCTIAFSAAANDTEGDSLTFRWGGCAAGRTGTTATCRATTAGSWTAWVEAIDRAGGRAFKEHQVTVSSAGNQPPVSRPAGPYTGVVGVPVILDGRASTDPEGAISTYTWSFGDGTWSNGAVVGHAYAAPGNYALTLQVWDPQSATSLAAAQVQIRPQDDPDGDGLTTARELQLGSNPNVADTNGDGMLDGAAYSLGLSLTNLDMDADGVANAIEIANGTSPFKVDTDGDSHGDATDVFPLDPTRWQLLAIPGDLTPPVITISTPEPHGLD